MRTISAISNCECTDDADVAVFTIEYIPPYRFAQFKTAMERLEANRGKDFCLTLTNQLNEMSDAPVSLKKHVTRFMKEKNVAEALNKIKSESAPAKDVKVEEVVEETEEAEEVSEETPPEEKGSAVEGDGAEDEEQDVVTAIKKSVADLQTVAASLQKTAEDFKTAVVALEMEASKQKQRDDVEKKIANSESNIVDILKSLQEVLPSKTVLQQLQDVEIAGQTADASTPPKTLDAPPKRGFIRKLVRVMPQ